MKENFAVAETQIPLSYIVYCLSRSLFIELSKMLAKNGIDITVEQYRALYVITRHPGNTQQWISNTLFVDKSSLSRIVNTLIQKGFVMRERIRGGGNLYSVQPTAQGKQVVAKCYALSMSLLDDEIACLSEDEKTTFREMLMRILNCNGHPLPE